MSSNQRAEVNIKKLAGCIAGLITCSLVPTVAMGQVDTEARHEWTLSNGHVSRTLAFNGDSGLTTLSWRNTETGTEFMGTHSHQTACKEFRLKVDAVMLTGSARDIRLDGAPTVQHHKAEARLEIEFRALKAPLRITVHYVVPTEFAGIRQWLTLENTGEKAIVIRNLSFDCQSLQPGSTRDLIAFGNYGEEPRETFFTGRVNDVAILLENAKSGEGFAVLNEAPGYLRRTELGGWEPGFQAMYDTDLFPFERRLNPGEKFETAATSVVFYHRGTPSDPHWVLPEYVEQVIAHNKNTQPPPWIYNDWEPWNGRANNTILKGAIQQAAAIGLDLMTIDEGWEKKLGENTSAAERFPNGLKPIFQMTPIRRAKRGLWLPVSLVSETSKPYLERPEWVCRGRDGKPKKSQGQGIVMCMASPYKQLALDRISDAIREYNLDYVKLDLTTVFNTYGEEPGCYAIGHEHASAAESSVRIYESLAWLAGQLHRQFPNLLIDYTFELWGEKHLIDYGLLRVADLDWMSNVEDHSAESAGPLQVRTLLYQRGMAIPTEDMLIGNMQAEVPTWQERMATAMASAPVFLGDLRRLSTENVQQMSNWRSRFQNLRQRVALYQSFFPLGSWRQPRMDAWDGYGRFARTGEGLIVVFGNDSHETSAKIAIPGFPDGHFWLDDWSNNEHFSVEGTDLSRGWTIDLNGSPRVRILEIAKQ